MSMTKAEIETMDELIARVEVDVVHLSYAVKQALMRTSDSNSALSSCDWLNSCIRSNYEHCTSKFPNEQCYSVPFNDSDSSPPCDREFQCGTKFDFTSSTIRISRDVYPNGETTDEMNSRIFETICKTRSLDNDWFVPYWKNASYNGKVEPRALMFGSADGVIRVYPGRQSSDYEDEVGICESYDPRTRPWYSAASSTRRNIIALLDVSTTMLGNDSNSLQYMKDTMSRVISATTISDKIAIITFDDNNTTIHGNCSSDSSSFCRGTIRNKLILNNIVNQLDSYASISAGVSNYTSALETALQVIDHWTVECSTSILLFTDNVKDAQGSLNRMQTQIAQVESDKAISISIFGYIMKSASRYSQTFECSGPTFHSGIWSVITKESEVVTGLAAYFEVNQIAYELQQKRLQVSLNDYITNRKRDVAWVEPYPFSMFGVIGTTVSAPVYDDNDRLLGVVGINHALSALDNGVFGYDVEKINEKARNKVNTDQCLDFKILSPCMFQFDKRSNYNVLCTTSNNETIENFISTCDTNVSISTTTNINASTSLSTATQQCCNNAGIDCNDITTTSGLWNNIQYKGMTYIDRGCCGSKSRSTNIGIIDVIEQCTLDSSPNSRNSNTTTIDTDQSSNGIGVGAIIGSVVGGICCLIGVFVVYYYRSGCSYSKRQSQTTTTPIKRSRPPSFPPMYTDD
jgi:von Willebrand factor type A domain